MNFSIVRGVQLYLFANTKVLNFSGDFRDLNLSSSMTFVPTSRNLLRINFLNDCPLPCSSE